MALYHFYSKSDDGAVEELGAWNWASLDEGLAFFDADEECKRTRQPITWWGHIGVATEDLKNTYLGYFGSREKQTMTIAIFPVAAKKPIRQTDGAAICMGNSRSCLTQSSWNLKKGRRWTTPGRSSA